MTVKIRTIAIVGFILIITMIVGVMVAPGVLLKMEKYDVLLTLFPKSKEAPDALYWSAEKAIKENSGHGIERIQIFPNSSSFSSSEQISLSRSGYAIHQWERLLKEFPDYRHAEMVKKKLAETYFTLKNWPQAERLYADLAATDEQSWTQKEAASYLQALRSRQPRDGEEPSLTGRVIVGGKGVEDVLVILRSYENNRTLYFDPFGYYPVAMTDEEGVFRFYDLEPDKYEVGVAIEKERIDGFYRNGQELPYIASESGKTARYDVAFVPKVETISPVNGEMVNGATIRFEWQPYPAATYYKVGITALERNREGKVTGTSSVMLEERWDGTTAEYAVETLRTYSRGVHVSMNREEKLISAQSVLGAVFPGGEFTWYVEAYDSEDRKISSSSGYFSQHDGGVPFFVISEENQLKGDRYVMEHNYEEAVKAYEKQLDDPYALRALAILWETGFRHGEEGDKAKALSYLTRLPNPSRYDYVQMARLHEELGNLQEKERIMKELEKLEPENAKGEETGQPEQ